MIRTRYAIGRMEIAVVVSQRAQISSQEAASSGT